MISFASFFSCGNLRASILSIRFVLVLLLLLSLTSCGGSGGSSDGCSISNCSPQALISTPSITAYAGQVVQLDGSASQPTGS